MSNILQDSAQADPREINVCETIGNYLDESNSDSTKRLSKIEALIKFLEFEKRVTEMTDAEKQHYYRCLDGPQLSDKMRATLDSCTTEEKRNYYIEMWARATYFTRCAWDTYLHTGKDKPQIPQQNIPPAVYPD